MLTQDARFWGRTGRPWTTRRKRRTKCQRRPRRIWRPGVRGASVSRVSPVTQAAVCDGGDFSFLGDAAAPPLRGNVACLRAGKRAGLCTAPAAASVPPGGVEVWSGRVSAPRRAELWPRSRPPLSHSAGAEGPRRAGSLVPGGQNRGSGSCWAGRARADWPRGGLGPPAAGRLVELRGAGLGLGGAHGPAWGGGRQGGGALETRRKRPGSYEW